MASGPIEGLANSDGYRLLVKGLAQQGMLIDFAAEAVAGIGAHVDDQHIGPQGVEVPSELWTAHLRHDHVGKQ